MAIGELGLHGALAQRLVLVELNQELDCATVLPQLMEEQLALDLHLNHKLVTHNRAPPLVIVTHKRALYIKIYLMIL